MKCAFLCIKTENPLVNPTLKKLAKWAISTHKISFYPCHKLVARVLNILQKDTNDELPG